MSRVIAVSGGFCSFKQPMNRRTRSVVHTSWVRDKKSFSCMRSDGQLARVTISNVRNDHVLAFR